MTATLTDITPTQGKETLMIAEKTNGQAELATLARKANERHGVPADAGKWFISRAQKKPDLVDCLMWAGGMSFIYKDRDQVRAYYKPNNHDDGRTEPLLTPTKRGREEMKAVAEMRYGSILDSWRVGDKALGDMVHSEVMGAGKKEKALAYGHNNSARFYFALGKDLPEDDTKTVRQVFKGTSAEQLLEEVCV